MTRNEHLFPYLKILPGHSNSDVPSPPKLLCTLQLEGRAMPFNHPSHLLSFWCIPPLSLVFWMKLSKAVFLTPYFLMYLSPSPSLCNTQRSLDYPFKTWIPLENSCCDKSHLLFGFAGLQKSYTRSGKGGRGQRKEHIPQRRKERLELWPLENYTQPVWRAYC